MSREEVEQMLLQSVELLDNHCILSWLRTAFKSSSLLVFPQNLTGESEPVQQRQDRRSSLAVCTRISVPSGEERV